MSWVSATALKNEPSFKLGLSGEVPGEQLQKRQITFSPLSALLCMRRAVHTWPKFLPRAEQASCWERGLRISLGKTTPTPARKGTSRAWEATEPCASPPLLRETFPTWQDLHFEPETLSVQLHGGAQPFQKALLAPCKVG